ncbi:MAG TPA: hypothetical protein VMU01_03640, partial [Rhizomicrobium sp.]|nr:hypothetical protein [Rhizomicrobium sp.]
GAGAAPPQVYDQIEERDPTGQFVVGKATADEVKARLGAPLIENRNRDGSFVCTYLMPTGDYTSYVFDKTGVLIRTHSAPKAD